MLSSFLIIYDCSFALCVTNVIDSMRSGPPPSSEAHYLRSIPDRPCQTLLHFKSINNPENAESDLLNHQFSTERGRRSITYTESEYEFSSLVDRRLST